MKVTLETSDGPLPKRDPAPGTVTIQLPVGIKFICVPCPNCYGGHFRGCQWCGDTGRVMVQQAK